MFRGSGDNPASVPVLKLRIVRFHKPLRERGIGSRRVFPSLTNFFHVLAYHRAWEGCSKRRIDGFGDPSYKNYCEMF